MAVKATGQFKFFQLNQPAPLPAWAAFENIVLGRKGSFALLIALNEPLSKENIRFIPPAPPDGV